ncbi:TIGR03943 family putative permease subunit [Paenibacillus methanolicus]|uniref:Putative repeat protein (TIGR03943 family) n=1 Tax=Paenibacillus methanolicus TaxID=582686 RepID=A0A5S5BW13_9BACL|nr:TIGR03943 family protein [Paenibacillus methanolicus]TYP71375.1 putative repeat protein (TIGR03943 family) [Paenibacillus methanolicus]
MAGSDRRRMVHYLIRAVLLGGFALFIVQLARGDGLSLYIAPRMEPFVKLSALALYASAIYQVYAAFRASKGQQAADCGCDHEPPVSIPKNVIVYGMFVLPLALGFLLPEATLGSSLAAKKGMTFAGAETLANARSGERAAPSLPASGNGGGDANASASEAMFPSDEYTASYAVYGKQLYAQPAIAVPDQWFIETLTTLDLYRKNFIGKQVELSGFVYRDEAMGADQFAVSRFAMNCCSADSLPYGLVATFDNAAALRKDSWVKVSGTLEEGQYDGGTILQLLVTHIESIRTPDSPYVYPDYNFDKQFE